jgi:hypothetical protein
MREREGEGERLTNLAIITISELFNPVMLLVCIRLTIAAIRSGMWGDRCRGICKMSCKTKLPTKSDTELSNAGSKSLHNH